MIGMIRHLVQAPHAPVRASLAAGLFWLGASLTAGVLGVAIAALGMVVRDIQPPTLWALCLGVSAVALGAADLGLLGLSTPSRHVQTCSTWWYALGRWRAWFAWGAHLGLGFLTIRATSLYWLVLALVLLFASPAEGLLVMISYAAGLIVGWGSVAGLLSRQNVDGGARLILGARGAISRASGMLLFMLALLIPALALHSI